MKIQINFNGCVLSYDSERKYGPWSVYCRNLVVSLSVQTLGEAREIARGIKR